MKRKDFADLLHKLFLQNGQEKLHSSFQLSQFVKQLRAQGEEYGNKKSGIRSRTAA